MRKFAFLPRTPVTVPALFFLSHQHVSEISPTMPSRICVCFSRQRECMFQSSARTTNQPPRDVQADIANMPWRTTYQLQRTWSVGDWLNVCCCFSLVNFSPLSLAARQSALSSRRTTLKTLRCRCKSDVGYREGQRSKKIQATWEKEPTRTNSPRPKEKKHSHSSLVHDNGTSHSTI